MPHMNETVLQSIVFNDLTALSAVNFLGVIQLLDKLENNKYITPLIRNNGDTA